MDSANISVMGFFTLRRVNLTDMLKADLSSDEQANFFYVHKSQIRKFLGLFRNNNPQTS
jgi:hypothetical protein